MLLYLWILIFALHYLYLHALYHYATHNQLFIHLPIRLVILLVCHGMLFHCIYIHLFIYLFSHCELEMTMTKLEITNCLSLSPLVLNYSSKYSNVLIFSVSVSCPCNV